MKKEAISPQVKVPFNRQQRPGQIVRNLNDIAPIMRNLPRNPAIPPSNLRQYEHDLSREMNDVQQAAKAGEQEAKAMERAQQNIPQTQQPQMEQGRMAASFFDLFVEAQVAPQIPTALNDSMPMGDPTEQAAPPPGQESSPGNAFGEVSMPDKFQGFQSLRKFLDSAEDPVAVSQSFRKAIGGDLSKTVEDGTSNSVIDPQSAVSDMIVKYIEGRASLGNDQKDSMAEEIYSLLPDNMKQDSQPGIGEGEVSTFNKTVASVVDETDRIIQKIAQNIANNKKASAGFNMKKFAQHKSLDQAIMFGPGQTRVDPFSGQLISNWHLVERNKGFGIKIDDILDIDWESIWRSTIMDKYSQPYRNKDGEWVGGYLNKRFEVARNVPEGNNLQLKPGQLRRPYLPEFSSTEARLEAMREKEADKRGYKPVSEGKPYNWKEASSKKKVK